MRIILEHFKCYEHLDLELNDAGITLLSGSSGNGKTSIVQAIFFAISGKSDTHIVRDGERRCSVRLFFKHLDITRTKGPQSLTLRMNGETVLEQVAQARINQYFSDCFELCGYIQQSYHRSFLFMSARDKIEVLKKVCFSTTRVVPEQALENIKERLKQHQQRLQALYGQRQLLDRLLSDEPVDPPQPCSEPPLSAVNIDACLRQHRVQHDLHTQWTLIDKQVQQWKHELDTCDDSDTEPVVNDTIKRLEHCLSELRQLRQLENEVSFLNKEQSTLEYSREECEESVAHYTHQIELLRTQHTLEKCVRQLEQVRQTYQQVLLQKEELSHAAEALFQCPACQCDVYLSNNELFIAHHQHNKIRTTKKTELGKLEQQLKGLESKLFELENAEQKMATLREQVDEFTREQCEEYLLFFKQVLDRIKFIDTTRTTLQTRMDRLPHNTYLTEEKLVEQLKRTRTTQQRRDHRLYIQKQYDIAMNERVRLEKQREEVPYDTETLEAFKDQWTQYAEFCSHKQRHDAYLSRQATLQDIQVEISTLEVTLVHLNTLRKIITKTETTFVEHQMAVLSLRVNELATHLFIEPIQVEFKAFKQTKTDDEKIQPTIKVYYKNRYCDAETLSGGEIARLNLCFILAFATFFDLPLLMLDECTANLDAELVEQVIEQLNQVSIPKIILIAHQIVEGEFSQVIAI
jgi:exonuclease SbcC